MNEASAKLPLSKCEIRLSVNQEGDFFVDHPVGGQVAHDYPHAIKDARSRLELAWMILDPNEPGQWKTVGMLRTLRQALREWQAQEMPCELPPHGAAESEVRLFLSEVGSFDEHHHGMATF